MGAARVLGMAALTRTAQTGPAAVTVDCANGVGFRAFQGVLESMPEGANPIEATLVNSGATGRLNESCGADFVKTTQSAPPGIECAEAAQCASFDGDADRLMFFTTIDGRFQMLDGDRIAALCAAWLDEQIKSAGLSLKIGIVQTAYANGASTKCAQPEAVPMRGSSLPRVLQVPRGAGHSGRVCQDGREAPAPHGAGLRRRRLL